MIKLFQNKMASGSKGKKKAIFLQNLPHLVKCDRCDIKIPCPRIVKSLDGCETEVAVEDFPNDASTQTNAVNPNTPQSLQALVDDMTLKTKAVLLSLILKSEAKTLWLDQENACLPPDASLSMISSVDPDLWLQQRHPLLLALAFGLSIVRLQVQDL